MHETLPSHWFDTTADDGPEPRSPLARGVEAVGAALFASHAGPPDPRRLRWLGWRVESWLRDVGGRGALVFRVSLFLMVWLAPLLVVRVGPLWALRPASRHLALDRWERSPLGMTLFAVKAILCIHYFEHRDAAAEIGFDGGCAHVPAADAPAHATPAPTGAP